MSNISVPRKLAENLLILCNNIGCAGVEQSPLADKLLRELVEHTTVVDPELNDNLTVVVQTTDGKSEEFTFNTPDECNAFLTGINHMANLAGIKPMDEDYKSKMN